MSSPSAHAPSSDAVVPPVAAGSAAGGQPVSEPVHLEDPVPSADEEGQEEEEGGEDDAEAAVFELQGTGPEWAVAGDWYMPGIRDIDVDALDIDHTLSSGQIRVLSDAGVEARMQSLRTNPPSDLLQVLVWLPRPGHDRYVVLGGQHTIEAVRRLRQELVERAQPVPRVYRKVQARVVRPETPLDIRQRLAGDHQAAQGAVRDVPLWQVATFVVRGMQSAAPGAADPDNHVPALLAAIQKSGRPRPSTWKELKDTWFPFLHVCEALGDAAPAAIRRLEEREKASLFTFRNLRSILTPPWRARACSIMLDEKCTVRRLEAAIQKTLKDMWVAFHWRRGNPHIDDSKSMRLFCTLWFVYVITAFSIRHQFLS